MLDTGFVDLVINESKNLAVLTCGVAAYCWVRRRPNERGNRMKIVAEAAILSIVVAYSMIVATLDAPGLLRDGRVILIALSMLFSGPLVAGLVTTTVILVRIYIGGVGMSSGIFVALSVLAIAGIYRDWLLKIGRPVHPFDLVATGLLASTAALSAWLVLPFEIFRSSFDVRLELALFGENLVGLIILGTLVVWDEKLKGLQVTLADDEARFHTVIDNLPVSIAMRDRSGLITLLNRRYRDVYGPDINRFVGRDRSELRNFLFHGPVREDNEADERTVETTGRAITRYLEDICINGRERSLLVTTFSVPDALGRMDSLAVIGADVSELRDRERQTEQLQSQLVQSGKMKAMGQLAGGIAHDFNNLLGAMSGFASFLFEDLADRPKDQRHANRILDLCERAKSLVSQVLAFARADRVDREFIDIRAVIQQAREFMAATLPATTKLVVECEEEPVYLNANAGQISQLVINLSIHASQALGGRLGLITIGLECLHSRDPNALTVREQDVNHHSFGALLPDQYYVRITVSDNGAGLDQATLDRIMEPFFATTASSDGGGLGLTIVHGIVAAYGGAYAIRSRVGFGTVFQIYLPWAPPPEDVTLG
jgi:PAS domain S-box-containing protein